MNGTVRLLASGMLVLVAAPASATSAAAAGTAGYCADDDGVTVVVDLTELDGDVVVRCAAASTGTGIDALIDAGFAVEGTQQWGTAFVCRLAGRPAADEQLDVAGDPGYQERCVQTPSTSAFWAYSYAENGATWTYSAQGASTRQVIEGGFEGWRFVLNGGSTDPAVAPTRPVVEEPTPTPSEEPSKQPRDPSKPKKSTKPSTEQPTPDPPSEDPKPTPTPTPSRSREPTDRPSEEPPAGQAGQPRRDEPQPSHKPGRRGTQAEPEKADKDRQPEQPDDLGRTTAGAAVTGELPTDSSASADTDATSGTATLIGAGGVALVALGAGLAAYRRRSHST